MRASTKGTLDIIHTKRLKLLKLSNEASCLTPTKLLKVKRIQVEGERLLCCSLYWEGGLSPSSYTTPTMVCREYSEEIPPTPLSGALMAPPDQRWAWDAPVGGVRLHPGGAILAQSLVCGPLKVYGPPLQSLVPFGDYLIWVLDFFLHMTGPWFA